MDLTPLDKESGGNEPQNQAIQFIEVKAGPFYQRLPYTEQGKAIAVNFLNALEIEPKKPKKEG